MTALELLHDAAEGEPLDLPDELRRRYGGDLVLPEECVYANFVSTIDGVVAIPSVPSSNRLISGGSEADRFVMGLLRAVADAVLVGCGTLLASPNGRWRAGTVFPPAADAFAELRRRLGHEGHAPVAIMTGIGRVDPGHPVLLDPGALVITTARGARALEGRLPAETDLQVVAGEDTVDVRAAIALLRSRGYRRILSEAGPRLFASLIREGLVDELFLTVSPLLAGRAPDGDLRLVEGDGLLPERRLSTRLLSLRRHEDHLFLRHALEDPTRAV